MNRVPDEVRNTRRRGCGRGQRGVANGGVAKGTGIELGAAGVKVRVEWVKVS